MEKSYGNEKRVGLEDIQRRFDTEYACRDYLFKLRWPDGFICPVCGCREHYHITTRHKYACKSCRYQASVTAGTVMDRSHLSLRTWIWAIYLVSRDKRGYSAMQLSRVLNLPYNTAWFLLHRIVTGKLKWMVWGCGCFFELVKQRVCFKLRVFSKMDVIFSS